MAQVPPGLREFDDAKATRKNIYDNVLSAVQKRFPVEDGNYRLELLDARYGGPQEYSLVQQKNALLRNKNLRTPIVGRWRLTDKKTGEVLDEREDQIMQVPYWTDRGTIINNGSEYTVISQSRLRPGVYARRKTNGGLEAQFNIDPSTGHSFRIGLNQQTGVFDVSVGQGHIPLYQVLRGLGVEDKEIIKNWGADLTAANAQKADAQAWKKLYERMAGYKADPNLTDADRQAFVKNGLAGYKVDADIVERTMGLRNVEGVTPQLLLRASQKLLNISRGDEKPDNRDNPRFAKYYAIEDFLKERVDKDAGRLSKTLLYKARRNRNLKSIQRNALAPYVDAFIQGSGLAMPGEEANPLSTLEQMSRISKFGEGGISSPEAVTMDAREVNGDYLGFVDPIAGPECFLPGSQIMSKTGFIPVENVTMDTELACLIDNRLEYHKPEKVICEDYDGMAYCASTKFIQYKVTQNHRLWFKPFDGTLGYRFGYASDVHGRHVMLMCGGHAPYQGTGSLDHVDIPLVTTNSNHKSPDLPPIDIVTWGSFLGWYISEGCVTGAHVRISQSKPDFMDELHGMLDSMPLKYYEANREFEFYNLQLAEYLRPLGHAHEKYIPEYMFDAPVEARQALLNALCYGDGRKKRDTFTYCTISERLAKDVERLCFSLGYSSNVRFEKDSRYLARRTGGTWAVHINQKNERELHGSNAWRRDQYYTERYTGKVYCVTVPGHIVYARFGDRGAHWTGNSEKIGVDVRATWHTYKGNDNKLYGEFLDARTGKTAYIDIGTAADRKVAFPGQDMSKPYVYVMKDGVPQMVKRSEVDYVIPNYGRTIGSNTNMNPMPTAVSPSRQFYAAKFWTQYLPQAKGEVPLVDSLMPDGKMTWSEYYGRKVGTVKSDWNGVVTKVDDDSVTVKDGDGHTHKVELVKNLPFNRLSGISFSPSVEVGQTVHEGDMLAHSNFTDKKTGAINMGQNLHVAISTAVGGNFEDAHVISESAAKRLATDRLYSFDHDSKNGVILDKNKYISAFPSKFTKEQIETLDDNGIVKPGTILHRGDPIVTSLGPKILTSSDKALGKLSKALRNSYSDRTETWEHDYEGKVVDAVRTSHGAKVNVVAQPPVRVGDKLSGRFGLKGVVGCYDDQTEVFTDHGWIPWADLTEEYMLACLVNGKPEFRYPKKLLVYDYNGDMIHASHEQLDYCVTPNHRMLCRIEHYRGKTAEYKIRTAESVYGKKVVHRCGIRFDENNSYGDIFNLMDHTDYDPSHERKKSKVEFRTEDVAEFLGWYISEGNLSFYHGKGVGKQSHEVFSYKVQISQRSGVHDFECENIEELLTRMGLKWYKHVDQYTFSSKAWYKLLSPLGKCDDKHIPDYCWSFGIECLQRLFDSLMLGDGSDITNKTTRHSFRYHTDSVRLADDIVRLSTLLGYAARTYMKFHENGKPRYIVAVKAMDEIGQSSAVFSKERYSGKVYCASVDGGILLVRRNGYPMWCGNSVIPDDEMPRDAATNQPYDMLLNPMGVLSRIAPGQIMEMALGKVAKQTGKQIRIPQLPPNEGWYEWTRAQLEQNGVKDSSDMFDPKTSKTIPGIGDGYIFVSAFHHLAEKKESMRGAGDAAYTQDEQPAKGGITGAKRASGLDNWAMLSHGASDVLKDITLIRGTRNDNYWNALKLGLPIPEPESPFIYKKFLNTLRAGGINVVEKGNITKILPQTDKDIEEMCKGRVITSAEMVDSDFEPVKGGLFDLGKTGGMAGNQWSMIELPEPVPNPIMEEPVRRVLGLTVEKMENILAGREKLDGKTGGEALKAALSKVDVDKQMASAKRDILGQRGSKRDDAVKVYKYLSAMKEQGLKPQDWMVSKVPVIPPAFRPVSKMGDVALVSDMNELYKDIIENANNFKDLKKDLSEEGLADERLSIYNSVKAAYGLGQPITPENQAKGVKGAIRQVIGTSPKFGMFQSKVISKALDNVGRGVVTPDQNLDMDQIGIPEKMAWEMYKPYVIRGLVRNGYPSVTAVKMVADKTDAARHILEKEMEDRPVIMDRAPTWHKYNFLAFTPHLVDEDTIRVCPLIVSGFNMDFDGDTVNIHVPSSQKAVDQAKKIMRPSENLISTTDLSSPRHPPSKEQISGLYAATSRVAQKPVRVFNTVSEAKRAYASGEIGMNDPIEILHK